MRAELSILLISPILSFTLSLRVVAMATHQKTSNITQYLDAEESEREQIKELHAIKKL